MKNKQSSRSIVASMPTMPNRQHTVKSAVISLLPQVDWCILTLNNFKTIPEWCQEHENLIAVIPENDVGGYGKIWGILNSGILDSDYYVFVDDDIKYQPNFIRSLLHSSQTNMDVVGIHGSNFLRYFSNWKTDRSIYSELSRQSKRLKIDIVAANGMFLPNHVFQLIACDERIQYLPRCMDLAIATVFQKYDIATYLAACENQLYLPIEKKQLDSVYMDLILNKKTPHNELAAPIWRSLVLKNKIQPFKFKRVLKTLISNFHYLKKMMRLT